MKAQIISKGGKELRLFSVQMFAIAIGRDRQTVKKWEKKGLIPKAPFMKKRGKIQMRLYPEYFVKAVDNIIKKFKLARGVEVDPIIVKAKIWQEIDRLKQESEK